MQLPRTVGLMKLKKCPYEQTCFLFMPVFLSSSSSTIDCRQTDIKMACSLAIVIHCSLSFDMRYSNDSSSWDCPGFVLLLLPPVFVSAFYKQQHQIFQKQHANLFITVINQLDAQNFCFTIIWPPDDEQMCSKHAEAWNKLIVKQKFCASSQLITEINILTCTVKGRGRGGSRLFCTLLRMFSAYFDRSIIKNVLCIFWQVNHLSFFHMLSMSLDILVNCKMDVPYRLPQNLLL